MWDGNQFVFLSFQPLLLLSENQCGMETELDSTSGFFALLSENQCGMETRISQSNQNIPSLSENQCGMETTELAEVTLQEVG